MSLIPYYLRHLRSLGSQSPAARMLTEEMLSPFARDPFFRDPFKYMRQAISELEKEHWNEPSSGNSDVSVDGKKLEVKLDVSNFKPEEIKVKTIGDEIVVEGRREEKRGKGDMAGWTRSHFERRFVLPEGFPAERVECHLDAGKLRLVAFRDNPLPERDVPIQNKSQPQVTDGDTTTTAAASAGTGQKESACN